MKSLIILLSLSLLLPQLPLAAAQDRVILPNSKLLRCGSSDCFQLWSGNIQQHSISPNQLTIDIDHGCVYGITATYDKSVPLERL